MFLREVKGKNKTYLSLVENYRQNGKVKQRTVLAFGDIKNLDHKIADMARKLLYYCGKKVIDLEQLSHLEKSRHNWGAYTIINNLWEQFNLKQLFNNILEKKKIQFDFNNVIKLLLSDRLCHPRSKYQTYLKSDYYYGFSSNIKLHHLYRSLDVLSEFKEQIEYHLYCKNKELYNMPVDVVFFDVTTFYFESKNADTLKDFGFGKDGKFNEVQIVFSLLINEEGRPVGFDIFSGNTYEGHTLINALKKLKHKYKIDKVIIVADRGINFGENLKEIKDAQFQYIVGCRLKNLKNNIKKEVLNLDEYKLITTNKDNEIFKYKIINYVKDIHNKERKKIDSIEEKIICTWSSKRAKKDQIDRERLVDKANYMLMKNQVNDKRGAKKYINADVNSFTLATNKIAQDALWDGFYGIETNITELSPEAIAKIYNSLWKIEESFRLLKSHLEARPVFHWTPNRIKGHFVLSYLAFLMERTLELGVNSLYAPCRIREAIIKMEFSIVAAGNKEIRFYAPLEEMGKKILQLLNIEEPVNTEHK